MLDRLTSSNQSLISALFPNSGRIVLKNRRLNSKALPRRVTRNCSRCSGVNLAHLSKRVSTPTRATTRSGIRTAASGTTVPPMECPIQHNLIQIQIMDNRYHILGKSCDGPILTVETRLPVTRQINSRHLIVGGGNDSPEPSNNFGHPTNNERKTKWESLGPAPGNGSARHQRRSHSLTMEQQDDP